MTRRSANDRETIAVLMARIAELEGLINTPQTADWLAAVPLEAAHQTERWGSHHDEGKTPLDWFWLVGYLAQKAATAAMQGEGEKAKHHTISTAACLLNWHRHLTGERHGIRPGILEPAPNGTLGLPASPNAESPIRSQNNETGPTFVSQQEE